MLGRSGVGRMVSVLAFYANYPRLKPDARSVFSVTLFERKEIKQKEANEGPFKNFTFYGIPSFNPFNFKSDLASF